jgi:hypothetical protein
MLFKMQNGIPAAMHRHAKSHEKMRRRGYATRHARTVRIDLRSHEPSMLRGHYTQVSDQHCSDLLVPAFLSTVP